jgi:hypothetical protein
MEAGVWPFWSGPPYGDDPRDQLPIQMGADYYNEHAGSGYG